MDYPELYERLVGDIAELRKTSPQTMGAYSEMVGAAGRDGALDAKTKELIALGISVAVRSESCVAYHMRNLVELGASRAEVEEAMGTAVYMGGGPAVMSAGETLRAFDAFHAEREGSRAQAAE
jgi:AhpD family alkylhydroperoxidase